MRYVEALAWRLYLQKHANLLYQWAHRRLFMKMKAVQRILGSAKSASAARCFSSTPVASSPLTVGDVHVPGDARTRNVTVLPGHG
jgi:hypothetical protein